MFVSSKGRSTNYVALFVFVTCLFCSAAHAETPLDKKAEYGQKFAAAITNQNVIELSDLFNARAFSNKISKQLFTDKADQKDFSKEFSKEESTFLSNAFLLVFQGDGKAQYLHTLPNGRPLILVSFPEGSIDYMELVVKESRGEFQTTDIFLLSSGKYMSDVIFDSLQLILAPSNSMLARAFGVKRIDKQTSEKFKNMAALMNAGDIEGAYNVLQSFPEEIRNTRTMLDRTIAISQRISMEEYEKQLSLLAKHYGDDESIQFMLIDYYVLIGDNDRALQNVNTIIERYGENAGILYLKANIQYVREDHTSASELFSQVVMLDPENINALDSLLTLLAMNGRFDELVERLKQLELDSGYIFGLSDFDEEPELYGEFIKSEAFKAWIN